VRAFLGKNYTVRFLLRLVCLILALTLVWFVSVHVIGFSVNVVPKGSLVAGKAKWEQKGSASYRMTIQVYQPLRVFGQYTITVKHGKVVDGGWRLGSSSAGGGSFTPLPPEQIHKIREFTIDQMFASTQAQLVDIPELRVGICLPIQYTVETDPDLGYIKTFYADSCQVGLLCGAISECFSGFKVLNLELLPD
jgi:hypothetical protein